MPLVQVKAKAQITIPAKIRKLLGIKKGDYLEADVKENRIILTPKEIVDTEEEKAKERIFALIKRNWEYNRDVPEEEIEADITEAVKEAKQEEFKELYGKK